MYPLRESTGRDEIKIEVVVLRTENGRTETGKKIARIAEWTTVARGEGAIVWARYCGRAHVGEYGKSPDMSMIEIKRVSGHAQGRVEALLTKTPGRRGDT